MLNYKVIFHIDEAFKAREQMVIANINNLLEDLGESNVEVELLANGDGVKMFVKSLSEFEQQIISLYKRGVKFVACSHSLEHLNINSNDLFELIKIVPSGVGELVRKQKEGWGYIRP